MQRFIAIMTVSAFALLFALVSNLYQPPMDFNLHCTVHDRVASALGGGCNMALGGIFTSMTAIVLTAFIFWVIYIIVHFTAREMVGAQIMRSATVRVFVRPDTPLHEFYYHGTAHSRKFL